MSFRDEPMSVSFSGSGYLATYQLGVVQGLLDNAPWVLLQAPRFYGASAGSLVAAAVACGADIGHVRDEILSFTRRQSFGFSRFNQLERVLRQTLPNNAHRLANGRLHISMTRLPDGHNILVSEFHSKEDLIKALLCSCFVPVFCGMIPPRYKGVYYMDGGLTNIQPTQDSCPTLTVCPFAGDVDICPSDKSTVFCELVVNHLSVQATFPNFIRVANALFPRDWEAVNKAFYSGYQDTLFFLQHRRCVRPYPTLVSELQRVITVEPKEWVLPDLEATEDREHEVNLEELPLEGPLKVVTVEQPSRVFPLDTVSSFNPGQSLEVLMCNIVAHLGMISLLNVYLPPRALPYLLLPLTLTIWATTAFIHRVEPWVLYAYLSVYWLWQDLKHMLLFLLRIIVSSVRRSVQHKILLLIQTHAQSTEKIHPSIPPFLLHNPSISPSLHSLLFTLDMRRRQRESRQNVP
ncbi:patatin-like phospholipase domain-containing protein 4 [Hoplias malabaricus]|uniref:patatin-like phospholipase domain-containing protein 4 n=1 Tax=Hoplias malabaricus TaxID=27720 RepID=UPI003461FBF0